LKTKEIVKIILSQKEPLMKLMELLNEYRNDEGVLAVKTSLLPLYDIYSTVDESSISESQINAIRDAAMEVRSSIVAF
jgi:hypothetical protein